MAIALTQYLADAGQRDAEVERAGACASCSDSLHGSARPHPEGDTAQSNDCYFCGVSALIDGHPIGRPMARSAHA